MKAQHSRLIEDLGFVVALLIVTAYSGVDIGVHAGLLHPTVHTEGVSPGQIIVVSALILPKTLGRATAGKVWSTLASSRLFGARKSKGDS